MKTLFWTFVNNNIGRVRFCKIKDIIFNILCVMTIIIGIAFILFTVIGAAMVGTTIGTAIRQM